jgi:hypothetical protein
VLLRYPEGVLYEVVCSAQLEGVRWLCWYRQLHQQVVAASSRCFDGERWPVMLDSRKDEPEPLYMSHSLILRAVFMQMLKMACYANSLQDRQIYPVGRRPPVGTGRNICAQISGVGCSRK